MFFGTYKAGSPANRDFANKETTELPVRSGVLVRIYILIPAGHHTLAHLIIRDAATPFMPETEGGSLRGEDQSLVIEAWREIDQDPYTLYADVWNEDDLYPHYFYINLLILPKWLAYPWSLIRELIDLMAKRLRVFKV